MIMEMINVLLGFWKEKKGREGFFMKEAINWKRVIVLTGAVIAFIIGSGFATGQELIQYYTAYGAKNILVVITFAVMFIYYCLNFARAGYEEKFEKGNDIYYYYCGKHIGAFFDYFSTIFLYLSFWVMIGGAASTLNQQYGLPTWVGAVLLAATAIFSVAGGLESLVDKIGMIGPAIVIICLAIGIITFVRDFDMIPAGLEVIKSGAFAGAEAGETMKNAGANWFISGVSYAGFTLLWFAAFTADLGARNKKNELYLGIILATVAVGLTMLVISFGMIANINTPQLGVEGTYIWNANIPNLILAERIVPAFASVFAVVIFAGIYTTAVPLLYNPVSRFAKEGTKQFKVLSIVLGVVGLIVGLFLPFKDLVNIIYVYGGYLGFVVLFFMIVKDIKRYTGKKNK